MPWYLKLSCFYCSILFYLKTIKTYNSTEYSWAVCYEILPTLWRIDIDIISISIPRHWSHIHHILIMLISQFYNEFREIATDNPNPIERFPVVTAIRYCQHQEILHDFHCGQECGVTPHTRSTTRTDFPLPLISSRGSSFISGTATQ